MNVFDQFRSKIRPRHALGIWLNHRKLYSRAFVPDVRDRQQLKGRRPFWNTFGEATIPASQWTELRQVVQSDFIAYAFMISNSVGGSATGNCRLQIRDIPPEPGRKPKYLSIVGVNDNNFAGTASDPHYLRKPYRFRAGHQIVVRIQNLQTSSNKVQLVMEGVFDE